MPFRRARHTDGRDASSDAPGSTAEENWNGTHLPQQMRDYARVGISLFWQRQASFISALILAGYYYDLRLAILNFVLVVICEAYDMWCFRRILRMPQDDRRALRLGLIGLYFGTVVSAAAIVFFVIWISAVQGPRTHFMPLFFLFAASLFAAMNNHQLLPVLKLRLIIYGIAFLFIPAWDIWQTSAPIQSPLWTQMFTNIFVLYFVVDCSRVFLNIYRRLMQQMDRLREEHEKTKIAYKAKSEFLSTMSHELRTPMTSINGAVILARSGQLGDLPKQVDSVLGIAQMNCARLSALINDILDLQKIEAGKLGFSFKAVELGDFLRRSLQANSAYGEKFNVNFVPELLEEPIYVEADERRLEQVMANILSNAAKFSHPGDPVTVRLEADDHVARILVVDQGVGLAEEHRDLVFDQFSQLDASDKRHIGGTGLGMNISKRILDAHNGTIDYRKNAGPGTTFFVELRRVRPTPRLAQTAGKAA